MNEPKTKSTGIGWFDLPFAAFCGVLLPLVTLVVESLFHLSGSVYVDPIPSWWHVLGIASVAVINFIVWVELIKNRPEVGWLPFAIGAAIGISAFYAAVFLPLTPFGVIGIIAFGFGFLPLAPVLAFVSAVRLAFILKRQRRLENLSTNTAGCLAGFIVGVMFLLCAELPNLCTQIGTRQAISSRPEVSRAGIRLLRAFGSEQSLLRSCYQHMASVSDIPSLLFAVWHVESNRPWLMWHDEGHPLTIEEARQVYYRTYGRPFNTVARPKFNVGLRSIQPEFEDWDFGWDSELAGENVGARQAGLSLADSTLISSVDADLATSYTEWTMVFQNNHYSQQEARMQIELPPGGVVSRATLWVNGEPKEAAFGERGLVRRAYQATVTSKRDPLLVTSVGPNKIMLQCFPIPPKQNNTPGTMKVRVGITAPCMVPALDQAQLILPRISEHGFPVNCRHQIRVDGPSPLTATVDDSKLRSEPIVVRAKRNTSLSTAFTSAPLSHGKSFVLARLQQQKMVKPSHLYVVIDGAGAMAKYIPQVAEALTKIPADVPADIRFASDEISALTDPKQNANLATTLRELNHAPCVGGPDNMHLLADMWKVASKEPGSAVVWIHGPQPILFGGQELADSFKPGSTLYDLELYPSPNRLVEKLPRQVRVIDVGRTSDLKTDLQNFVAQLCGTASSPYVAARSVSTSKPAGAQEIVMPALSSQLVSLCAYDETMNLISKGDDKGAVRLAARNRLVTPVTGAVVLETAADYKKNGIDPNNPDNNAESQVGTPGFQIGAAPEPEEYALMIVALAGVAWQLWRRRLQKRTG